MVPVGKTISPAVLSAANVLANAPLSEVGPAVAFVLGHAIARRNGQGFLAELTLAGVDETGGPRECIVAYAAACSPVGRAAIKRLAQDMAAPHLAVPGQN